MDTLPSAKEISRSDFESESFDVQSFLVDHCQFRSLGDLKQLVAKWEQRLKRELEETVNENYQDLISTQGHLNEAKESVVGIKLDVLQFKAEISKMERALTVEQEATNAEIAQQKLIRSAEYKAKMLMAFLTNLDKLEKLPKDLTDHQLVELGRAVEELGIVKELYKESAIVSENLHRANVIRENVMRRMSDQLLNGGGFDVVMARARLCD